MATSRQLQPLPSAPAIGQKAASTQFLRRLVAPHVESFNYVLQGGLAAAVADIPAREFVPVPGGKRMTIWLEDAAITYPVDASAGRADTRKWPSECRERGITYDAPLQLTVAWQVEDEEAHRVSFTAGQVPIMIQSKHCHLNGLSPTELAAVHEEMNEVGGYFICNGIERIVRMLQMPRRNYPMAISRASYRKRGALYTDKGVQLRAVRADQSAVTLTLHYLADGNATLRFSLRKQEFFIPIVLVLRALRDCTDKELFSHIMAGDEGNTYLADRVGLILRDAAVAFPQLVSRDATLAFLGERFRTVLDLPASLSDVGAGEVIMHRYICVHLASSLDKFQCLLFMLRKLYSFVAGKCVEDNADAPSNQEILLPGHLYNIFLKEKLDEALVSLQGAYRREVAMGRAGVDGEPVPNPSGNSFPPPAAGVADVYSFAFFRKLLTRMADIGKKVYYMLATGNVISSTGLDLMQTSGFTVVADKINFLRFCTHFRAVHRGQFFTEMKSTAVRKLLPEAWGFLCPVHTPDGSPCGLLNHLAADATIATHHAPAVEVDKLLQDMGVVPCHATGAPPARDSLPVLVDGRYIGTLDRESAPGLVAALRDLKAASAMAHVQPERAAAGEQHVPAEVQASGKAWLPLTTEIAYVPPAGSLPGLRMTDKTAAAELAGAYPGLFVFTQPARLLRPVRQLWSGRLELCGSLEQVYMNVAVTPDDIIDIAGCNLDQAQDAQALVQSACAGDAAAIDAIRSGDGRAGHSYTHMELRPTSMLSYTASLTPFSDLNQSPRNMYQCQMAKQTMATPVQNFAHRVDTKLYRIQTVQAPVVQTQMQRTASLDEYPLGCNAIVAVIAYTGIDMEDAMIVNKSSYERGFAHASVYKTYTVDLNERLGSKDAEFMFSNVVSRGTAVARRRVAGELIVDSLDADGLPPVGLQVKQGDPLYVLQNTVTGAVRIAKHKDSEPAVIEEVRLLGTDAASGRLLKVSFKLRYNRNPVVGDKFSSRHGQKGTLSLLWPQEEMPFSESGMCPDVIINPHAFPSRMTIGMLVESMAGKAGAMHGKWQDATPFTFNERQRAVDYFGEELEAAGYSYYGCEPMYSGSTGEELVAHIFMGVVYYQRLRHMVSDKSQVRATGPINDLTRQPVKGRKNRGGTRFGEMERDSCIAHGISFTLHDRLMNSSDRHTAVVCKQCGSVVSTSAKHDAPSLAGATWQVEESSTAGPSLADATAPHQTTGEYNFSCRSCGHGRAIAQVPLPYVYRYLANELAAMNIRLTLDVVE